MADQKQITLYSGDGTPKDIVLRELPVASVVSTEIFLYQGDATAKDVIFRNVPGAAISGVTYTLTASAGAFTLSGIAAALVVSRKLPVTVGTFALTGNATGLVVSRKLAATVGTFALTGFATGLQAAYKLVTAVGTFAFTGNDATLTYTPAGATYTMLAESVAFALTGNAATFTYTPAEETGQIGGGGGFGPHGTQIVTRQRKESVTAIRDEIERVIAAIEAKAAPVIEAKPETQPVPFVLPPVPDFSAYFAKLSLLTAQLEAINAHQAMAARKQVMAAQEMVARLEAEAAIRKAQRRRHVALAAHIFNFFE